MKLLEELCSEESIKRLNITPKTGLRKIKRIASLENKDIYEVKIERIDKKRYDILVKSCDTVEDLWRILKLSVNILQKGINWKSICARYNFIYGDQIIQKGKQLSNYGISEGAIIKLQRTKNN